MNQQWIKELSQLRGIVLECEKTAQLAQDKVKIHLKKCDHTYPDGETAIYGADIVGKGFCAICDRKVE